MPVSCNQTLNDVCDEYGNMDVCDEISYRAPKKTGFWPDFSRRQQNSIHFYGAFFETFQRITTKS